MENKKAQYKALASKVLVVAVEGDTKDWCAYADATPGVSHKDEWKKVALTGSKLPEDLARYLFPSFRHLVYRL